MTGWAPNSTVVSTSSHNFPNRLGQGANMFLASSELAAVSAALGRIPTMNAYMGYMASINTLADNIYRYLKFNEIQDYMEAAERARDIPLTQVQDVAWPVPRGRTQRSGRVFTQKLRHSADFDIAKLRAASLS